MTSPELVLNKDFYLMKLVSYTDTECGLVTKHESDTNKLYYTALTSLPDKIAGLIKGTTELAVSFYNEMRIIGGRSLNEMPIELQANFHAYDLFLEVVDMANSERNNRTKRSTEIYSAVAESIKSNTVRNLSNLPRQNDMKGVFASSDDRDLFIKYQEIAFLIEEARDFGFKKATNVYGGKTETLFTDEEKTELISAMIKEVYEEAFIKKIAFMKFGELGIIKIGTKMKFIPIQHINRVILLIRSMSHLIISSSKLGLRVPIREVIISIANLTHTLASEKPDRIGEYMKAARQLLMYDLEESKIMSDNPKNDYKETIDNDRKRGANAYYNMFKNLCDNIPSMINLSNIYRSFPHPDADLRMVFNNILGFKDANKINPTRYNRFYGTAMRAMFRSLRDAGFDVRLVTDSDKREVYQLVEESRASYVPVEKMCSRSHAVWSEVTFEVSRDLPKAEGFVIKPGDKSSQMEGPGSIEEIKELKEWSVTMKNYKPECKDSYGTVNDTLSTIQGTAKLSGSAAVKKFKSIIIEHIKFEQKYIDQGIEIEDIPSEDIENFLMSNDRARTLVGTEPKLGEFHKEYTRMFYLAEQFMKAITQRVERLARIVSRRQLGVSIVKGFEARQRDLERFCHAMTGESAESKAVFVSFDLSEFSKKFPQKLMRLYGKILSDLTGEKWLKRIDVIFRSALVIHNTRGYFNYASGVTGGFEGFLNFVWSSAHAVIMEISLESTGLRGELLTYSDDGLLYFITQRTARTDAIRRTILKIKREYSNFGLEFNVKKTFISTTIWEYLGDVCYDGHLLPMFVKELGSYGRSIRTKGVTTIAASIDQYIGQSRSMIKNGFSPTVSYFMMRYYSHIKFRRLNNTTANEVIEALFITPRNCGGMRLPSSIEMMSSSAVDTDSEFMADLYLYTNYNTKLIRLIVYMMVTFCDTSNNALSALMLGTRFSTKGLNTSGISVTNAMIEEIQSESSVKIATHPITDHRKRMLKDLLVQYTNIEPELLRFLLQSLTEWDDYNKSLALIKSSSARMILGKKRIKYFQSRDTNAVKEAIIEWNDAHLKGEFNTSKYNLKYLLTRTHALFMRDYKVAPTKPSARLVLKPADKKDIPKIAVRFEYNKAKFMYNQDYMEPSVRFTKVYTTAKWMSEDTTVTEISSARKLLDSIASIISYNPETYSMMKTFSAIFGISIPPVPVGLLDNPARRSVHGDKPSDVIVFMPRFYQALSSSRYLGNDYRVIYSNTGLDRTTYLELARCLSAIAFDAQYSYKLDKLKSILIDTYTYEDDVFNLMHISNKMYLTGKEVDYSMHAKTKFSEMMRAEFISSVIEHKEYKRIEDTLANYDYKKVETESVEYLIMRESRRRALLAWVRSISATQYKTIAPGNSISLSMAARTDDIIYAIEIGAFLALSLDKRKILSRAILRNKIDNKIDHKRYIPMEGDLERDQIELQLYDIPHDTGGAEGETEPNEEIDLATMDDYEAWEIDPAEEKILGEYMTNVRIIGDSIESARIAEFTPQMFEHLYTYSNAAFEPLKNYIGSRSIVSKSKLFITRSPSTAPGKFSGDYRTLYNEVFTNSITTLYSLAYKLKWDKERISKYIPNLTDIDLMLDILVATRPLLRKSEHRTPHKPANQTSIRISLMKMYIIVNREVERILNAIDDEDPEHDKFYDWSNRVKPNIADHINLEVNAQVVRRTIKSLRLDMDKLGEDHKNILNSQMNLTTYGRMLTKIKYYVRKEIYVGVPKENELNDAMHIFYQTVIAPFTTRVIEVPVELASIAADIMPPDEIYEVATVAMKGDVTRLSGIVVSQDEIANNPDINTLISDMINYYVVSHGVEGVKLYGDSSSGTCSLFNNKMHISTSGDPITHLVHKGPNKAGSLEKFSVNGLIEYTVIKTANMGIAMRNIYYLNNEASGVSTVVYLNEEYYIFFVGTNVSGTSFKYRNAAKTEGIGETMSATLARKTFDTEKSKFKRMEREEINKGTKEIVTSVTAANTFIRLQTHSYDEVTTNVNILAASRIMRDMNTENGRIAAYMLLKKELAKVNIEHIKSHANKMLRYGKSTNPEYKALHRAFLNDIAISSIWLKTAAVPPTPDVDDSLVDKAVDSVRNILNNAKPILRLPSLVCLDLPYTIDEVLSNGPIDINELINDKLYKPRLALLEGEVDEDFEF